MNPEPENVVGGLTREEKVDRIIDDLKARGCTNIERTGKYTVWWDDQEVVEGSDFCKDCLAECEDE